MLIEIFIDLVGYLAEFFGNKLAGSVDNDSKKRHSLSVIPFCIIVGILTAESPPPWDMRHIICLGMSIPSSGSRSAYWRSSFLCCSSR